MTLDEALKVLDQVLSRVQGTRQDHATIVEAFNMVVTECNKPETAESET